MTQLRTALLLAAVILGASSASAQFPLQTADGKSGLLSNTEAGLINYEASESRIGFRFVTGSATTTLNDPSTTYIVDAGFATNKGKRDLFKGGSFTPGFDAAITVSRTYERTAGGYNQFFGRALFESTSVKTVAVTSGAVVLDSIASTHAGAAIGFNHAFTEDVLWSTSVIGQHFWNETGSLEPQQVCKQSDSGQDATGAIVTVASCDDRYIAPLSTKWGGQIRTDFSWNASYLGSTDAATIGLLASGSVNMSKGTNASFNVSVGPAVFRPHYPAQVVFALLLEGIDVGNRLGHSPMASNQIRVRAYVGLPFDLLMRK